MTYAELTQEQQNSVDALCLLARPLAAEFARTLEKFQNVTSYWTGNVETILSNLTDTDTVPNKTGLAGAQDLTKAQLVNLVGYMITSSATPDGSSGSYNTNFHRALYAAAAGPSNIING